jgi:hypothetical protein
MFGKPGAVSIAISGHLDVPRVSRYRRHVPEEGDRGGDPQTDTAARPRKVPIAFPEDMYEWLREEAFKRHGAMADIVREAVNEYRERSVQQMRLPMKSDR